MISVVCVYNNEAALKRILLPSLEEQTVEFQWVPMDNTTGRWPSAASALNWGAQLSTGKYIMFVHQDVELGSKTWLEETEKVLDSIMPPFGIAGVIGMSSNGRNYQERLRGYICNAGHPWGSLMVAPRPVQTLDECLIIVPRESFEGFDAKTFDHWHCYGCDYALRMNENGQGAYAIPGYIYHRSKATNVERLRKYHLRLFFKHRKHYSRIYATTNGLTWFSTLITPMIPYLARLNHKLFPSWLEIAKKELSCCKTVLDLGCGYASPLGYFGIENTTGVEIYEPYLIESQKKALHNHYIQGDVTKIEFPPQSFDGVFCSEVLEHLPKEQGELLLLKMNKWAKKKVVITTPNGFINQEIYDENDYQKHLCGWTRKELEEYGFRIIGMSGWKELRGERGQLKGKPEALFFRMAAISHKITRYKPDWDFQLLGIKDVK